MVNEEPNVCEHDWRLNGPAVERYFICRKCGHGEYRRPWWRKWFLLSLAVFVWREPALRYIVGAVIVLSAWLVWADNVERKECERVGGRMVQTGTQTMWVYNHATKTSHPQQLSIIECVSRTPMGTQP